MLLYYLAVGRLSRTSSGEFEEGAHCIIASAAADGTQGNDATSYRAFVEQIMDKGATKIKPDKRIRLNADDGTYELHVLANVLPNDAMIVFFAVAKTGFGKGQSFATMFDEFKKTFITDHNAKDIAKAKEKGGVHKASQKLLTHLISTYGKDKLSEVSQKVDKVKNVMQDNVAQALSNVDNLNDLEHKADKFEGEAQQFKKQAKSVKKKMCWENAKLNMIIGGVVIIIIIIIIASVAGGDDDDD